MVTMKATIRTRGTATNTHHHRRKNPRFPAPSGGNVSAPREGWEAERAFGRCLPPVEEEPITVDRFYPRPFGVLAAKRPSTWRNGDKEARRQRWFWGQPVRARKASATWFQLHSVHTSTT